MGLHFFRGDLKLIRKGPPFGSPFFCGYGMLVLYLNLACCTVPDSGTNDVPSAGEVRKRGVLPDIVTVHIENADDCLLHHEGFLCGKAVRAV